ncbi:MAG: 16S rRNA (cytosine(1402)-N(4))-methyltransferase RsmH [Chloroflexi bacterium]|nr:16S rRNA (cytosine(1402)-N(4))-methyltransferase RsmH [Chloroflexota bacterium]
MSTHIPVLVEPLLRLTKPCDGRLDRVIDGTLGAGGHTRALLQAGAGAVLAFDLDASAIEIARRNLAPYLERVTVAQTSYVDMRAVACQRGWREVDAIILDLGLSSMQLDDPARGFAFRHEGPLDMRFDALNDGVTAEKLVNSLPKKDLAELFFRYGEEKAAGKIADAIVARRPIRRTSELASLIKTVVPKRRRMTKLHPATKVFQALRIAVNRELESLEKALPIAVDLLRPGGKLAVISFHSLEDRIVKRSFRDLAAEVVAPPGMASIEEKRALVKLVNRRPIVPGDKELSSNPRSRSAKLRVVEKLKFD